LPAGNLGMVAFLAAFRFGCPSFGLTWGTFLGYLASLAILALVISFDGLRDFVSRRARPSSGFHGPIRPGWPKACRRFSPGLEPCAW
jgi:hypothetical protein